MTQPRAITSPDDPALDELCRLLAERAAALEKSGAWPAEQLQLCGRWGVYEWFLPHSFGGQQWNEVDVVRGYLKLSAACLTTTFVITQRTGACQRIVASENEPLKQRLLPDLVSGASFATLGISHLTTSRRHLARPVMRAEIDDDELVLDGFSPWVTGGDRAQTIVTGATMDDGRQVLVALPASLPGVSTDEPARLVGLSASRTGAVRCRRVRVGRQWLLSGPAENVMSGGQVGNTGGLQTSTLAVGLASAAIDFLRTESDQRPDLGEPMRALEEDHRAILADLLGMAAGEPECTKEELRTRANSLALRSAQAALTAAKGTGYVVGHPAGRWCREALFFLVWSCPQPVLAANLCELAGISVQ